ncbi:MAG: ferrous iron transport protein A [Oscillospiraceae bacterium]
MNRTLKQLKPGESGTVIALKSEGAVKRRLIDMGITPGTEVYIRKVAPLGDPIEINLRGYELSIRKDDADNIIIEEKDIL